jgi:putative phosphoesterase
MELSRSHDGTALEVLQSEKIGFISDAHGNYRALEKGLRILEREGVKDVFSLGDALGYIPCLETLRILSREEVHCQIGNHEYYLLNDSLNPDRSRIYRLDILRATLDPADRARLSSWPLSRVIDAQGYRLHLVHGSPRDPLEEYVYPDSDLSPLAAHARGHVVLMGHTHRPFVRQSLEVTYINVGSCGLPRDDSRFASMAVFMPNSPEPWRIVRYDITRESAAMLDEFDVAPEVKELFLTRREFIGPSTTE